MTATVFSVFNAVLLRPLAYPDSERLLCHGVYEKEGPHSMEIVRAPDFS